MEPKRLRNIAANCGRMELKMTANTTLNTVVKHLIENWNKTTTSADLAKLEGVETLVEIFAIMHELVASNSVIQDAMDKSGKRVIVWTLANGQESAFALWVRYLKVA
jgi:hypothetical protein